MKETAERKFQLMDILKFPADVAECMSIFFCFFFLFEAFTDVKIS